MWAGHHQYHLQQENRNLDWTIEGAQEPWTIFYKNLVSVFKTGGIHTELLRDVRLFGEIRDGKKSVSMIVSSFFCLKKPRILTNLMWGHNDKWKYIAPTPRQDEEEDQRENSEYLTDEEDNLTWEEGLSVSALDDAAFD